MARWTIRFYPPKERRNSPGAVLASLRPDQAANIRHRLETIAEMERVQWPAGWVKEVQGILQLTAGDYRLYLGLDGNTIIVVSHLCRKTSNKAKIKDIRMAKENLKQYFRENNKL